MSFVNDLISKFRKGGSTSSEDNDSDNESYTQQEFEKAESSYAEYIAPACHYNEDTILNKGGELVQIIKVEDYVSRVPNVSLRDIVRSSVINVADGNVAFWLYTVREKRKFHLEWKNTGDFSDSLHEIHERISSEKYETFANTVYIAVVVGHLPEKARGILGALFFRRVIKKHKNYLAKHAAYLSEVTSAIVEALNGFSVSKLGLIQCKDGRWRSELLEFLSYVVTLNKQECFLDTCDNAHTIAGGCSIHMGFNAFRVTGAGGPRYGAILGVKSYTGDCIEAINACMQQTCEFIIVEVLRFVDNKEVRKLHSKQVELLELSGDSNLAETFGLSDCRSLGENFGECCESKVTCLVIGGSLLALKDEINRMVAAFSTIGAVVTRMDVAMEDCFWANMPGNFRYVIGMKAGLVNSACNFTMLNEFPSGRFKGGKWAEAITVFFSTAGFPYFFNFHVGEKGHAMCLGPNDFDMSLLLNFLLSESRRLGAKSIVFDYSGKSVIYSLAVGGKYHRVDNRPESTSLSFSPFHVENTKKNREMAIEIVCRMVVGIHKQVTDELRTAVSEAVGNIFAVPVDSRTPEKIGECLGKLGGKIGDWINKGQFAHLITSSCNVEWGAEFLAINAGMLVGKQECISVVLYYLLRSMERHLKGVPTILVMYEAWILDTVFAHEEEFDNWIERLEKLNVVVILASENTRAMFASRVFKYMNKHVETRIFMPNLIIESKQQGRVLGLSQEELDTMLQISQSEGHFFLKQGDSSVVLVLDLPRREKRVLSANRATIKIMYDSVAEKGKSWLEEFHTRCDVLENR